jgi:hypothetical protein
MSGFSSKTFHPVGNVSEKGTLKTVEVRAVGPDPPGAEVAVVGVGIAVAPVALQAATVAATVSTSARDERAIRRRGASGMDSSL